MIDLLEIIVMVSLAVIYYLAISKIMMLWPETESKQEAAIRTKMIMATWVFAVPVSVYLAIVTVYA